MTILSKLFPRSACRASLSDLASDLWLIDPEKLEALFEDIGAHIAFMSPEVARTALRFEDVDDEPFTVKDGVAHIQIAGPIMKSVPGILKFFGFRATSTVETEQAISRALEHPDVRAIFLNIDSPGGSLAGVHSLGESVFQARGLKPVHAHASDQAASAAYWIGSQASRFTASETAKIGSIGVYSIVADASKAAEQHGVTVHVLRSGEHKGAGEPGAPINATQLSHMQSLVDRAAEKFQAAVSRGRNLSIEKVQGLADGRVWFGDEARDLGLIDAVESLRSAHAIAGSIQSEEVVMTVNPEELAEVKAQLEAEKCARKDAEARANILELGNRETKKSQLKQVIAKHQAAGRVTPPMLEAVEGYAFSECLDSPEKLEAFLATFPVQTHAASQGGTPTQNTDAQVLTDEDRAMAKRIGLSAEDYVRLSAEPKGVH